MLQLNHRRSYLRAVFVACLLTLVSAQLPVAFAATHNVTAGSESRNKYEDQIIGGGHGDGDVWGGEQGTIVKPEVDRAPTVFQASRGGSAQTLWLTRLASLLRWLGSSLWFSNPE